LYPISVIIPVYQAGPRIQKHIEALELLAPCVRETIWVITPSADASCQAARQAAQRLGGLILDRPPGLYPAWNAGLAAAKSEFIYISTCGDGIQPSGLEALLTTLQNSRADVVISPPEMHPAGKRTADLSRDWPVFRFARELHRFAGKRIPVEVTTLVQILSGASSILGSCASCLFRASVFERALFPETYFHYGDTAWIYEKLPHISLAFHAQPVAQFWFHETSHPQCVDKRQVYQMMTDLARHLPPEEESAVQSMIASSQRLDALRGESPKSGWWLDPQAWICRWHRQSSRSYLLKSLHETAAHLEN